MTQIAYAGLFWTELRVSRDLFTDLTAEATIELSYRVYLQPPVEFKIVRTAK